MDSEIAIVGAGPTGLMLANLLGQAGRTVSVYERRETPYSAPRAIGYDPETLRLFQTIGCYQALRPSLLSDLPVYYLNGSRRVLAQITECPQAFGHSVRGTFYQPELEEALRQGLTRYPNVRVFMGTEVTSVIDKHDRVCLSLKTAGGRTHEVSAKYAVATDGGASGVRESLHIPFKGNTYPEKWLVVDTIGDDLEAPEIRFYCDPKRPAVMVPVSKKRRRWEFLVMPGDNEAELETEATARAMMMHYGNANPEGIERCLVYTFHARMAERFRQGRILLAGDAAHVMPPFAGQGLNSGMRDAANLAWKLSAICEKRADEGLLDSYETERRKHVEDMTKLAVRLGYGIMPTSRWRAWLRDRILFTLTRFRRVRDALNKNEIVPNPSLDGSELVNWKAGGRVGEMIEQPLVQTARGEALLDDVIGPGFVAISFQCDPETALSQADLATMAGLSTRFFKTGDSGDMVDGSGILDAYFDKKPGMLIVRPDRFIVDIVRPDASIDKLNWMHTAYSLTLSQDTADASGLEIKAYA